MKIKGIALFSDLLQTEEIGLVWPQSEIKVVKFMVKDHLPTSIPIEHLTKFVELYNKIGPAAISEFNVKEI